MIEVVNGPYPFGSKWKVEVRENGIRRRLIYDTYCLMISSFHRCGNCDNWCKPVKRSGINRTMKSFCDRKCLNSFAGKQRAKESNSPKNKRARIHHNERSKRYRENQRLKYQQWLVDWSIFNDPNH